MNMEVETFAFPTFSTWTLFQLSRNSSKAMIAGYFAKTQKKRDGGEWVAVIIALHAWRAAFEIIQLTKNKNAQP
jgi:hypothetical protein